MTYLDRVLYLYPGIQGVMYWHANPETGVPWASDKEAYDKGLRWENEQIQKPKRAKLDAINEAEIAAAADVRAESARKSSRDEAAKGNLTILAGLQLARQAQPDLTLTAYLDQLESLAA